VSIAAQTMSEEPPIQGSVRTTTSNSPGLVPPSLEITVVERRPGWQIINLHELWRYRELLFFLTWRDVKVRYKQTVLGAAWAILQPLATMLVFSLFFGRVAANLSSPIPYWLFVLSGLVPWMFFSGAITSASQSVVGSQNLVTKVYFPRLIIPTGAVAAGLVDLMVASTMLLLLMLSKGLLPNVQILAVPAIVLALVVTALGVGSFLAALTVAYRDFRYVVPFMVQLWMFATPCIYLQDAPAAGSHSALLLPLNPAYGLILNFRAAILGTPFDLYALSVSGSIGMCLLAAGALYFRRVERSFADVI
jgi:lipopolysaccharide transport system permease protein